MAGLALRCELIALVAFLVFDPAFILVLYLLMFLSDILVFVPVEIPVPSHFLCLSPLVFPILPASLSCSFSFPLQVIVTVSRLVSVSS